MTRRELDREFARVKADHDILQRLLVAAVRYHGSLRVERATYAERAKDWVLQTDPTPDGDALIITAIPALEAVTEPPVQRSARGVH